MPIPRPVDVYMTPEQAQAVLDEVATHLKAGKWSFDVPNTAIDIVRRELETSGWAAMIIPGQDKAVVYACPQSAEAQQLRSVLSDIASKAKN